MKAIALLKKRTRNSRAHWARHEATMGPEAWAIADDLKPFDRTDKRALVVGHKYDTDLSG